MDYSELDKTAYTLAKEFLVQSGANKGVTYELVEKYLHLDKTARPRTLTGLYERMLESAQNANMKAGVIGGSIGGVGNLRPVLCGFEPARVLEKYPAGWENILDDVVAQLSPRGSVRRTPRSIWPQYCQTILSAAKFLSQFASADDLYDWVATFDKLDERARPALPMLLATEIVGFGFPLACDFLKELGYENFSKPDIHVKEIFEGIGLCPLGSSDYEVFKAAARVARSAGVTPYNVDKLFWLVGSWKFYEDPHIGNNGRVEGRKKRKKDFIKVTRSRLEQMRAGDAPDQSSGVGNGGRTARVTTCAHHGQQIDIHEALQLRDQAKQSHASYPDFRCVECGKPVRPHKEGGHAGAHFEHRSRNPNCRLSDAGR